MNLQINYQVIYKANQLPAMDLLFNSRDSALEYINCFYSKQISDKFEVVQVLSNVNGINPKLIELYQAVSKFT